MVAQNICNGFTTPASWEQCFSDVDGFKLDVRNPTLATVFDWNGLLFRLNLFLASLIFLWVPFVTVLKRFLKTRLFT